MTLCCVWVFGVGADFRLFLRRCLVGLMASGLNAVAGFPVCFRFLWGWCNINSVVWVGLVVFGWLVLVLWELWVGLIV